MKDVHEEGYKAPPGTLWRVIIAGFNLECKKQYMSRNNAQQYMSRNNAQMGRHMGENGILQW